MNQRKIGKEGDNLAGGHPSPVHQQGACQHDQHQSQVQKEIRQGIGGGHDAARGLFGLHRSPAGGGEAFPFPALAGQGLDNADPGGILPENADHGVDRLLSPGIPGNALAGHQPDGEKCGGANRELYEGQRRGLEEGQYQPAQDQHGGPDAAALDFVKHLVDIVGVVGQPGDNGGYGEPLQLGLGEKQRPLIEVPAELPRHIHGHPSRHAVGRNIAEGRAESHDQHQATRPPDGGQVPGGYAAVDDAGQQQGQQKLQYGGGELHRYPHRHPRGVGAEIAENGFHAGPPFDCLRSNVCENLHLSYYALRRQVNPYFRVGEGCGLERGRRAF